MNGQMIGESCARGYLAGGAIGSWAAQAQSACDRTQTALESDLEALHQSVNRMDAVLGILRDRLRPVSLPEPPLNDAKGASEPTPTRCPMSYQISAEAARLHQMCNAMDALMARLEV
jgi:hypothetical protein